MRLAWAGMTKFLVQGIEACLREIEQLPQRLLAELFEFEEDAPDA